jgi:hypothetical protein
VFGEQLPACRPPPFSRRRQVGQAEHPAEVAKAVAVGDQQGEVVTTLLAPAHGHGVAAIDK